VGVRGLAVRHTGVVRLIATDVDGTIVTSDRGVTTRTAAAVTAARASGVLVALVTGRPLRWLTQVVDDLGGVDALVIANGAITYRLPSGFVDGTEQLLDRRTIPTEDVIVWAVRLRGAVPGIAFGLERPGGFGAEPGYEPAVGTPGVAGFSIASLPELLAADSEVVKLLARLPMAAVTDERPGDRLLEQARRVLAGLVSPVHADSRKPLIELGPPGVDKATGLAFLAESLRIEREEVVVFGDMPNDVSMLTWAGRGYAMADGHPEAIAAADAIAEPHGADGVALAIEELLTGRLAGTAP